MNKKRIALLAYLAGIVDGEGSIIISRTISKQRELKGHYPGYSIRLQVGMNDGNAVDVLYGLFGGRVQIEKQPNGKKDIFRWYCYGKKALKAIKDIYPYLRVKKKQAEVAIRFHIRKEKRWAKGGGRYKNSNGSYLLNERDYQELRRLKKQTRRSFAAVETKSRDIYKIDEVIVRPTGKLVD